MFNSVPKVSDIFFRKDELAVHLTAAALGDVRAFEQFYQQSLGRAYAVVRRIVGNNWVEDVLAESYLQAWRELANFDPNRGSAMGWLLTIARSRALDKLRSEKLRSVDSIEQHVHLQLSSIIAEVLTPESLLQTARESSSLHRYLLELNANERWVLALAYFRDLSQSEIANETGMPLGTVKSLMTRAQRKLKTLMEPQ